MTFQELTAELIGTVPGLAPALARRHLQRAWRDIRNSGRQWSWQYGEQTVILPQVLTTGTANVTQYTTTVVLNAAAAAALIAAVAPAGSPAATARQFRAGGTAIYNITIWDGVNTLTLDRPFADASNTGIQYQIYQCYYQAPVSDFVRWISLVDPVNNYDLELDHPRQELDVLDPGRQSTGQPTWAVSYRLGPAGSIAATAYPYYELWPGPTYAANLLGYYQRRGPDLVLPGDTLPPIVSDELILARTYGWHTYPWAFANVGRFPELKGPNWGYLINDSKASYLGGPGRAGLLQDANRQDDETFPRGKIIKRGRSRSWPVDSRFFQTHGFPPSR